jgi:hypothetical protein
MIVNFRVRVINRGARNLVQTPMLIKKIKIYYKQELLRHNYDSLMHMMMNKKFIEAYERVLN